MIYNNIKLNISKNYILNLNINECIYKLIIIMNTTSYIFPNNNILEAGIDESNRGGLIGNVVTACVVLKKPETEEEFNIYNQIKDSKKLTKKKRKEKEKRKENKRKGKGKKIK